MRIKSITHQLTIATACASAVALGAFFSQSNRSNRLHAQDAQSTAPASRYFNQAQSIQPAQPATPRNLPPTNGYAQPLRPTWNEAGVVPGAPGFPGGGFPDGVPQPSQTLVDPLVSVASTVSTNPFDFQAQRISAEEMEEARRLSKLLSQMRSGKVDGEELEALRAEVQKLLSEQLDRDLANREQSLEEIERRAADLRKQLELRRQNKEQTLQMLLMLAENPAAGIGIPDQWLRILAPNDNRFPSSVGLPALVPTLPAAFPARHLRTEEYGTPGLIESNLRMKSELDRKELQIRELQGKLGETNQEAEAATDSEGQ